MTPQQTLSVLIVDLKENIFGRTYMHYVIQSHCHIFESIKLWRAEGSTGEGGGEGTGSTHSSLDRVKKYVLYVKRFPPPTPLKPGMQASPSSLSSIRKWTVTKFVQTFYLSCLLHKDNLQSSLALSCCVSWLLL